MLPAAIGAALEGHTATLRPEDQEELEAKKGAASHHSLKAIEAVNAGGGLLTSSTSLPPQPQDSGGSPHCSCCTALCDVPCVSCVVWCGFSSFSLYWTFYEDIQSSKTGSGLCAWTSMRIAPGPVRLRVARAPPLSHAGDVEAGNGTPVPSARRVSGSQPSLGQLMASRRSVNPHDPQASAHNVSVNGNAVSARSMGSAGSGEVCSERPAPPRP